MRAAASVMPKQEQSSEDSAKPTAPRKKKNKKSGSDGYRTDLRAVLKKMNPDVGASEEAIAVVDGVVRDVFAALTRRAARLCAEKDKKTLGEAEVLIAVEQCLGERLGLGAICAADVAVGEYDKSFNEY